MQSRAENCYLVTHIVNGMPLVTVVTPCYNAEPFIGETIESVQNQTFQDWEHIVVDDGSTDQSLEVIQEHVQRDTSGRLRVLHQENGGVCRARNVGFAARSPDSRYVLFLDADDRMKPDMLDVLVQHMEAHPEVALTYCLADHIDVSGQQIKQPRPPLRYSSSSFGMQPVSNSVRATPVLSLFDGHAIPSTSMIRCHDVEEAGGFDEALGQPAEDCDLFARIGLKRQVHRLHERLIEYRRHSGQVTRQAERKKQQMKRLGEKWSRPWNAKDPLFHRRRHIWRTWNGCTIPQMWLHAARDQFRSGRIFRSLLLAGGSIMRYIHFIWITATVDFLRKWFAASK